MTWTPTRYYVYRGSDMWSYPRLDRAIAKARTLANYAHNGEWTVAGDHPDYDTSYHTPTYCIVFKDGTIQLTLLATGPTDTATEASV